jgi:phosphoribosylamine--glycine ligase
MLTADGPMLIEYNTRFGDPECEVLMPRLDSDLTSASRAGVRTGAGE